MAMICSHCNYHTDDNAQQSCPRCGQNMQFTMLGPRGGQPEAVPEGYTPAWAVENPDDWMAVEQPLQWRTAQISAGIGFYFAAGFVWRWLMAAFVVGMFVSGEEAGSVIQATVILSLAFYVIVSVLAGAVAGSSTINWLPQGLGVAGGLLVIPLILLLFFHPDSLPIYLITMVLTTGFTVLGAYLGHRVMPPSRVQKTLAEMA